MHMMRKWGAFDEGKTFYDPKRQLVQEDKRQHICTGDEWRPWIWISRGRKTKREEDVNYSQWKCKSCGTPYDCCGDGWSKSCSGKWYCPKCCTVKEAGRADHGLVSGGAHGSSGGPATGCPPAGGPATCGPATGVQATGGPATGGPATGGPSADRDRSRPSADRDRSRRGPSHRRPSHRRPIRQPRQK